MNYCVLRPETLPTVFEKAKPFLPDMMRDFNVFNSLHWAKNSMFFEVGINGGAFWLSGIHVGHKATIHVVLWDKDVRKECLDDTAFPRRVIRELFRLLSLRRLDAYIPASKEKSCRWAERLGFTLEGVLRKHSLYDGEPIDIAAYALVKEEL